MNRGTIAIVVMLVVGVCMAGYAWWHQTQRGKRIQEFLGTETVQLLRHAPEVEVYWLQEKREPATDSPETLLAGCRKQIVTNVQGLVHARHALILDYNYQFGEATESKPKWKYAMRFIDGDQSRTVLIAGSDTTIQILGGKSIRVHEAIHEGLLEFVDRLEVKEKKKGKP